MRHNIQMLVGQPGHLSRHTSLSIEFGLALSPIPPCFSPAVTEHKTDTAGHSRWQTCDHAVSPTAAQAALTRSTSQTTFVLASVGPAPACLPARLYENDAICTRE
jgi:hypothetical protein